MLLLCRTSDDTSGAMAAMMMAPMMTRSPRAESRRDPGGRGGGRPYVLDLLRGRDEGGRDRRFGRGGRRRDDDDDIVGDDDGRGRFLPPDVTFDDDIVFSPPPRDRRGDDDAHRDFRNLGHFSNFFCFWGAKVREGALMCFTS